eukprot:3933767-Rhodomonas_salina.2
MSTTYRARKRYRQGKSPVWRVKSPVPETVTVYVNGIRPNDPVFQCTTKKIIVPFKTAPGDVGTQLALYHKYFLGNVPADQARIDHVEVNSFRPGRERRLIEAQRTDADVEEYEHGGEEWKEEPDANTLAVGGGVALRSLEEDADGELFVRRGVVDHDKAKKRWLSVEASGAGQSEDDEMVETEADRLFEVDDHESEPCSPSEDVDEDVEDVDEAQGVLDSATANLVTDSTVDIGSAEPNENNPYMDVIVISSDEE